MATSTRRSSRLVAKAVATAVVEPKATSSSKITASRTTTKTSTTSKRTKSTRSTATTTPAPATQTKTRASQKTKQSAAVKTTANASQAKKQQPPKLPSNVRAKAKVKVKRDVAETLSEKLKAPASKTSPSKKKTPKTGAATKTTAPAQSRKRTAIEVEGGGETDSPDIKPKRSRKTSRKDKDVKTENEELESTTSALCNDASNTVVDQLQQGSTDRTDPCVVFPTEVWHQILSFLPLSQVAKISVVSKAWLDGSRTYPVWHVVCQSHKALGEPKRKYRSHMALVCSKSYWICDLCHSYTTGKGNASEIPLPVENVDDNNFVWLLCHGCRIEYYIRHPEPLREVQDLYEWQKNKITKTDACCTYYLADEDLYGLDYQERRNPHYRSGYPMRLYNRYTVQKRALKVHGGWVGVDAFGASIARKRSAACKVRGLGSRVWTCKRKPNSDSGELSWATTTMVKLAGNNSQQIQPQAKMQEQQQPTQIKAEQAATHRF
ncbi:hypothetical protein BGZ98_009239 [Dissophora globulifera]|nr:hypothetical protein BGZ98_009239 [Dissophora globulifera]